MNCQIEHIEIAGSLGLGMFARAAVAGIVFGVLLAVRYVPQRLVQATNGYLYGTTYDGGAYGSGTVFKIGGWGSVQGLVK